MEGDAGASRLNPTDPPERVVPAADDSTDDEIVTEGPTESAPEVDATPVDRPSRMSRGWFVAIFAVLLVLTAGAATGGRPAPRSPHTTTPAAPAHAPTR